MMYDHYIRIDEQDRIVDGFSTAERAPEAGDIYLHSSEESRFELYPGQIAPPLYFAVQGQRIYDYKYEHGQPCRRSKVELEADMPPVPPAPDTGTRLAAAETDIATLAEAMWIILGEGI